MTNRKKPRKVFMALSGGVDSAVGAALLQQAGYQVAGCFMRLSTDQEHPQDCLASEAEDRARRLANYLDIPFFVFDLRSQFDRLVIQPFLKDYQRGVTPNPCVFCNNLIKLELFWTLAQEKGADLMATGHYVCRREKKQQWELHRGVDKQKDQSYFLWRLNQEQLSRTLFPLGRYRKHQVRRLAQKWHLPVRKAAESMEVCFIPHSIDEFLTDRLDFQPGPIINDRGQLIGQHRGLPLYTVGQRKKIGLAGGPYYVRNKDIEKNILLVTKDKRTLKRRSLSCNQLNWLDGQPPKFPITVKAKVRYRNPLSAAKVDRQDAGRCRVDFRTPQSAVTAGQSVVFYKGSKLMGGGVIIKGE